MIDEIKALYCPALRMKRGELEGVQRLSAAVAAYVIPRFIVPPPSERDDTMPPLFMTQPVPDISTPLSTYWANRLAFIDFTYIINEYGRNSIRDWLPAMFARARRNGARPIPLAHLSDMMGEEVAALRQAIAKDEEVKFALCVPADAVDPLAPLELKRKIDQILSGVGLPPTECAVIVDFRGAEFSDPDIVAPIIEGALQTLQEIGRWNQVIFQGTHYPETNPAADGSMVIHHRNEWLAWKQAVSFDSTTAKHMIFGDYAADCAKMTFGESGGRAIAHIRYTTPNSWRIQRAEKLGSDSHRMHCVYKAIVKSGDFAGSNFSDADAFIARGAKDATARMGNSTTWRQLNTSHHITRAVVDIAAIRGIEIERATVDNTAEQPQLI